MAQCHSVLAEGLHVVRDHHVAGEYSFTPSELTLSIVLGSALTLEQVSDGRLWLGRSTRGAINVMPARLPRVFRHHHPCSFACITIPDASAPVRSHVALRDEPLRMLLEAVVTAADAHDATRLFRDAVGDAVVARLQALDRTPRNASPYGLSPHAVSRVIEYLDAHLAKDVAVDELARVVGLRPTQFSTLFRTTFGEPPHQHVIRLRVERARRLLEQGLDPSAAAVAVGFYDQSHLGRHMRRLLGVTPGQIVKSSASIDLERHASD